MITFPPSTNLTAIVVPVIIVLLILVAVVVVAVIVAFCLCKSRKLNASNFRKMSVKSQKENSYQVAVTMKGEDIQEKEQVDL